MKKILGLLFLAVVGLSFAACSDDDEVQPSLEINAADTGFEADGGEGGISVSSLGKVDAVADKAWIEITSVTADSVHFRVETNPGAMLRTGKITITGTNGSKEVTILQKGATFGIYADSIAIKGMGGEEFSVAVKYTMSGTSDLKIEGTPDWLTVTPRNDSIVFTATRNSGEDREAELTVTASWKSVKIKVSQNALRWLNDFYNHEPIKEILLTADEGEKYSPFIASEDLVEYDPEWSVAVAADCDWLTIGEDYWGDKTLVYEENETGKTRNTVLEITAKGEVVGQLPVFQLPVDNNGTYFRGTWTLHSVDETGTPQENEVTISVVSPFSPTNLKLVGLDQQFGEDDPAKATLIRPADGGIPYVEMKCQNLGVSVTDRDKGQQWTLWIVPMTTEGNLVPYTACAWNFVYDRETEDLVVCPNDAITNELPEANDGMQFPGFGILGKLNNSNNWANFGLGLYFPDPSRNAIWLERVAE